MLWSTQEAQTHFNFLISTAERRLWNDQDVIINGPCVELWEYEGISIWIRVPDSTLSFFLYLGVSQTLCTSWLCSKITFKTLFTTLISVIYPLTNSPIIFFLMLIFLYLLVLWLCAFVIYYYYFFILLFHFLIFFSFSLSYYLCPVNILSLNFNLFQFIA